MTLAGIRLRKKLLPRFRHLAFESLHDRITLDASLPFLISDGSLLLDDEFVQEPAAEVVSGGDYAEVDPGEVYDDSGEVVEDSSEVVDDFFEVYDDESGEEYVYDESGEVVDEFFEVYDESGEVYVDESGEVYDEYYWEEYVSEEYYVDDESIMYAFMTGEPVADEDAVADSEVLVQDSEVLVEDVLPVDETVADGGLIKTLPDEEFALGSDDQFVLGAEGQYLPMSAVQRTLTGIEATDAAGDLAVESEGDLRDVIEATAVTETWEVVELTDTVEFTTVIDTSEQPDLADLVEQSVFETSYFETGNVVAFMLPLELTPAGDSDLQELAPAVTFSSPAVELTVTADPLAPVLTSGIAPDQSGALQLAITSGLSQPAATETLDESDESILSSSNDEALDSTSLALTAAEEEESDEALPEENESAEDEDEVLQVEAPSEEAASELPV